MLHAARTMKDKSRYARILKGILEFPWYGLRRMVGFAKERFQWIKMRTNEIIAFALIRALVILETKRHVPFEQKSE